MPRNSERILTEYLVLNAQCGRVVAMDQLLRIWYPKLLAYSTRQLADREAARDVVQDAVLTIAKTIRRLRDPAAFPTWAYQILHRRGIDQLRKTIRQRERETADIDIEKAATPATDDSAHTVYDALRQLNDVSYQVIHLHYLHGLSVTEIADVCNIPAGTVKSRLHTARAKLRQLMEEDL